MADKQALKDIRDTLDKVLKLVSVIPSIQTDLATIKNDIISIKAEQGTHTTRILNNENALTFINDELTDMKANVKEASDKSSKALDYMYFIEALKCKTKELNDMMLNLEAYGRRENLIFDGIPEVEDENCFNTVKTIMVEKMKIPGAADFKFDRCHRLHAVAHNPTAPRAIIVRFNWYQDRDEVWWKRFNLKGSKIFLREDFPGIVDSRRRALTPVWHAARAIDRKAFIIGDILVFRGHRYTLESLPDELSLKDCGSKEFGDFHFFSGRASPFSNFHRSPFELDGTKYTGGEQYFQYQKALFGKRNDIAARILLEDEPVIQKRLGDSVKIPKEWHQGAAQASMGRAAEAKFTQNTKLKNLLLKVHRDGKKLVECNPNDRFWGIGLHISRETEMKDTNKWKGENMLGRCLTELATQLSTMA